MLGRKERGQLELFITGSLRGLIPDDHDLVKVDQVLDLGWIRAEVAELYCADNGRPGVDPEVAVRLMLAGPPGLLAPSVAPLARPIAFRDRLQKPARHCP